MRPRFPRLQDPDARLRDVLTVMESRQRAARRRLLSAAGMAAAATLLRPFEAAACSLIPSETAGPYPGDGTNGPNVLTQSGVVRNDIRSSFGSAGTSMVAGTPMLINLHLVSTTGACAPLPGLAVYLWHCDAVGRYSLYSSGVTGENWLRGVQVSDANGTVSFLTVFPGCYVGRWPHIHFEVYASLAQASTGANAARVSQVALPEAPCRAVYAQAAYGSSTSALNGVSLATDNVFRDDGGVLQLATMAGDNTVGWSADLEVGVALAPSSETAVFADGFED